jgi:short-subunit dehydrogenase
MTTKLLCSCCNEVIHILFTDEFCDDCRKKIDDGEIEGLSESISFELEEFGIKVILVEPGVIQTDFFQNLKIKGNDTKSPYYKLMDKRIAFLKAAMKNSVSSSDQVADTILHAVKSGDPEMRYVIGNDATNSIHMRKSLSDREFMKWIKDGMFHGKGFAS